MGKAFQKPEMPAVKTDKQIKTEENSDAPGYGSRLPDSKLSRSELEKRNRRRARNREAAARQRDKRIARVDALETEKQGIEKSNQKLRLENDQLKSELVRLKEAVQKPLPAQGDVPPGMNGQISQLSPILVGLIPSPVYAIATSTASQPCFHFPVKAETSPNNDVFSIF